jgi:ketosteroid isomerase-like protein
MTRVVTMALLLVGACAGGDANGALRRGTGDTHGDPVSNPVDLRRDLEATVLEGYSQLSLGNLEAYGDTVADDQPVVLIRLGPEDVHVGMKDDAGLATFRLDPCVEVLSKNLEVHLSEDRSVGWTFDDVSCRVPDPFEGRLASIPLRVTAVYQRHLDTWVLVLQHVSYGLPIEDVISWARAGRLRRPADIDRNIDPSDGIRKLIEKTLNGILLGKKRYRERKVAVDDISLVLWPGPDQEYHGSQISEARQLEELFGVATEVRPLGAHIGVARNKKLAWVAVNIQIDTVISDDPTVFALRATYVFERRDDSAGPWVQVQAHVSAPIVHTDLTKRVFGIELPDLSDLAAPR